MRPGNFQDGTFEKIIITVAEITLIQVSFLNVGSKQKKNKNEHPEYHSIHTIQKSDLLKAWEFHFSLAWVMEFSITSPHF